MTNKYDKIRHNFTYHPPKDNQPDKYKLLRESAFHIACQIEKYCPDSREKSLAMTNLEQAIMWANASIARNE
ncbi:MAG: hypothetical protein KJN62_06540 [Deltaproteobacteria bacterium]|nr:hypothetical protein [Deltaproteobacteria bacterium]